MMPALQDVSRSLQHVLIAMPNASSGPVRTCTNGLSTLPAPLAADCTSLAAAVNALAHSELTNTFPCNFNNAACTFDSLFPPILWFLTLILQALISLFRRDSNISTLSAHALWVSRI
jgi:hypothetical protein